MLFITAFLLYIRHIDPRCLIFLRRLSRKTNPFYVVYDNASQIRLYKNINPLEYLVNKLFTFSWNFQYRRAVTFFFQIFCLARSSRNIQLRVRENSMRIDAVRWDVVFFSSRRETSNFPSRWYDPLNVFNLKPRTRYKAKGCRANFNVWQKSCLRVLSLERRVNWEKWKSVYSAPFACERIEYNVV